MNAKRTLLFGMIVLLFVLGQPVCGQLAYEGSSSIGQSLFPDLAKAFEAKSGIPFKSIKATDSDQGFKGVVAKSADIGGLSRLQTADELKSELGNQVIGYDAVVIYIHPGNMVQSLSSDQLQRIFLGEIKNWKEVGGSDTALITLLKNKGDEGGTTKQFLELIMGGKDFATPAKSFDSHQENIEFVASNPGAITFAALAFDEKKAKIVSIDNVLPSRETLNKGEYPLARPYLLVYLSQPENEQVKKFMEFVFTSEGQAIVKKYVVPVMEP